MKKEFKTNKGMLLLGRVVRTLLAITLFSVIAIVPNRVYGAAFEYKDFDWKQFQEKRHNFWQTVCEEDDKDCQAKVLEDEKKFYTKLYKTLASYDAQNGRDGRLHIDDNIIIETVYFELTHDGFKDDGQRYNSWFGSLFSGYNVDENSDGSGAADVDWNTVDPDYFKKETDTIETLADNMIAYETVCYGIVGDATKNKDDQGNVYYTCSDDHIVKEIYSLGQSWGHKCTDKLSVNELGFWEYFGSKLMHDNVLNRMISSVFFLDKAIVDQAYEDCKNAGGYSGGTYYDFTDQRYVSTDRYFDFLRDNNYFDKKAHLQKFFKDDVLDPASEQYEKPVDCLSSDICENSLDKIDGAYEEFYGNIVSNRLDIIYFIIDNINGYGIELSYRGYGEDESVSEITNTAARQSFYWPIGSDKTEVKDGRTYATDDPASTTIVREFGLNENPRTHEQDNHYGIDIAGEDGKTNVIAAYAGEVISIVDTCKAGDYTCNDGYGNMIIISHSNGDYTVYGHLNKIESNIVVGYDVMKGEVIGKVGQTGDTTQPALHYEIRVGGNSVDNAQNPTDTSDPSDPRPVIASGDFSVHETELTQEQFCSKLRTYCNSNSCSVFSVNCDSVYSTSIQANVNPELVVVRAMVEGFSPGGSTNNYWGINCTNTGGGKDCRSYSSLTEGIKGFAGVVSKYNTASEMMSKYAYIGAYWYNPGSWSTGGCKYYPYIAQYMSSSRSATVKSVCNSGASCNTGGGSCTKTTDEDQHAYATWQVANKMGPLRHNIWGL